MANIPKVSVLLGTIKEIAIYLNDDEIRKIGLILQKAIDRMIREQEGAK